MAEYRGMVIPDDELADARAEAARREAAVLADAAVVDGHRESLAVARDLLRAYGTPDGLPFPEVLSPVQTAVIDYRDSGIRDAECDEHIMWINARVNEINAAALYGAGVLK